VIASTSSGIGVLGIVLLVAAGFLALVAQTVWAGLAGLTVAIAHNVWAWRRAELCPIDRDSSKAASQASWLATAVIWLIALFH
jgi:hypothetical protein